MTWLLFLVFLGYAAYEKITTVPAGSVDKPFLMSAALVLAVTAVAPFFVSYLITRATQLSGRTPAIMIGFISAVTLSVVGYWVVWTYYGGVVDLRVPMQDALKLGLVPGLIMGLILAADSLFRRRA
jgi:ABC-type nickel/cobalt efflux system permease component RcnA